MKRNFKEEKQKLLDSFSFSTNGLEFSLQFSLLVEQFIQEIANTLHLSFAIVSSGSFSRRELSPYSDIDIMFIVPSLEECEDEIKSLITGFWDQGIEVSHTVRMLSDIERFSTSDLHSFTQFFETRFLAGNEEFYHVFRMKVLTEIQTDLKDKLLDQFIDDTASRYAKYGNSSKMIEPNVKNTAGGLRDLHIVEWLYTLISRRLIVSSEEVSQSEIFIKILAAEEYFPVKECERLLNSYSFVLGVRNILHVIHKSKHDRLEFQDQIKVAEITGYGTDYIRFMKDYFRSATIIFRIRKSFIKQNRRHLYEAIPDTLSIDLDENFALRGETIVYKDDELLPIADIMKCFYFRAEHVATFDANLGSIIIDSIDQGTAFNKAVTTMYFRRLLRLPKDVGKTLGVMNELGFLSTLLPEFTDLQGYIQHGVYHAYTADEHTMVAIENMEELQYDEGPLGRTFLSITDRESLILALIFHDVAKPIDIEGHAVLGADIAESVMIRFGYPQEMIERVKFLVANHLFMAKIAFHRNLNNPETLNNFIEVVNEPQLLDMLYIITYADMSAVNPQLWTKWKGDLLNELFRKAKAMLEERITGEQLLISEINIVPGEVSKYSRFVSEKNVVDHISSIDDAGYTSHFSDREIARHIEEILLGNPISTIFNDLDNFTSLTIITKDRASLLAKLTGALLINDVNIHDAKIFTRKDGIVIDNFTVSDFRTHKKIDSTRYEKIEHDLLSALEDMLQINTEMKRLKSRWWRLENKLFKRQSPVRIKFEQQSAYTIIDIHSPDRLGFLYTVTQKLTELGMSIYFAKIHTQGDEVVDSFYVLTAEGKPIQKDSYEFIRGELTAAVEQIL